jgi:hypothetical protein
MKNRIVAVIVLILFILLLADLFIFKIYEEIGVILYVLIVAVFLLFFYNKKPDE